MKTIQLTQGKVALVDDEDFEIVNNFKWCLAKKKHTNYAVRKEKGQRILLHRFILNLKNSTEIIDHADGDGLNNQRKNIRICTKSQNNFNKRKLNLKTSSKYIGVFKDKKSFVATITKNGIKTRIGAFKNETDAALAYDLAAKELHGAFAKQNFK